MNRFRSLLLATQRAKDVDEDRAEWLQALSIIPDFYDSDEEEDRKQTTEPLPKSNRSPSEAAGK